MSVQTLQNETGKGQLCQKTLLKLTKTQYLRSRIKINKVNHQAVPTLKISKCWKKLIEFSKTRFRNKAKLLTRCCWINSRKTSATTVLITGLLTCLRTWPSLKTSLAGKTSFKRPDHPVINGIYLLPSYKLQVKWTLISDGHTA